MHIWVSNQQITSFPTALLFIIRRLFLVWYSRLLHKRDSIFFFRWMGVTFVHFFYYSFVSLLYFTFFGPIILSPVICLSTKKTNSEMAGDYTVCSIWGLFFLLFFGGGWRKFSVLHVVANTPPISSVNAEQTKGNFVLCRTSNERLSFPLFFRNFSFSNSF